MHLLRKLLVFAVLLTCKTLYTQDFDKAQMDSLFSIIENNERGMGSISLFLNGEEIYSHSYGYANIEREIPAGDSTLYRIGSVSKTFTATIIMRLVEKGELSLFDSLSQFFPDIPNAENIAIDDLLRHRSGLFNFTNAPEYLKYHTNPHTREQLMEFITAYPMAFEPGEKGEYSNTNYVLLTFIAEDVTGKDYAELVEELIAEPLGLKNTYVGESPVSNPNEAQSYSRAGGWKQEAVTNMSIPRGAGAIVSTPYDMNVFLYNLFEGNLVNRASLRQMMSTRDGYGLGLFQVPFYDKAAYGHTGGIDGFQANAFHLPGENLSLAFASNAVGYPMNDILIGVLSIYFGKDYELPEFPPAVVLSPEELEPYPGVYASPQLPMKLTIFVENDVLMAQGAGQPSFPLEAAGNHIFRADQFQVEIEFKPEESMLILKQGGGVFEMDRE
ncbi:MAG: serine hydrolase domain-containing protein [bacterium]